MGDRCYVRVEIYGRISPSQVPALVEAIRENFCYANDEALIHEMEDASKAGRPLELEADEINYGQVEETEDGVRAAKLGIRTYNGEGGSYGASMRRIEYEGNNLREQTLYEHQYVGSVIELSALRKIVEENDMAALRRVVAEASWVTEALPPFCITGPLEGQVRDLEAKKGEV